ncbi:MAG TPA: YihY/virulence factor BrkB family protein [Gammaproteobacteria bacterium]|nr:YihY/virulence factor BrkB family protein [Gammaproteobacteria bacterium]
MEDKSVRAWSRTARDIGKEIVAAFFSDRPFQLAAALGYYTLLSIAPLLLLLIGVAGLVFSEEAARGQLVQYIGHVMGRAQAEAVQAMLAHSGRNSAGVLSTIIGTGILIFGATTVFAQLQTALNQIWNVEVIPRRGVILNLVRTRLFSLGIVMAMAFILLVSMVLSTLLASFHQYVASLFPGAATMLRLLYALVSFGVVATVIALVFKFVPDVIIRWRDVWVGAIITSALFTVGKYLIGVYLQNSRFSSGYGAAGSIILVVAWVYYTSLILFLGAEVTQIYARRFGTRIRPSAHARFIREGTDDERR